METIQISQEQFEKGLPQEPAWSTEYRKKAFHALQKSTLPPFRYGLNIFIKPEFDFSTLNPYSTEPVEVHNTIVYDKESGVNLYAGNSLPKEVDEEGKEKIQKFMTPEWEKKEDHHQLYHLHQACANDFILIHIPKSVEVQKPIEIHYEAIKGPLFTTIFVLAEANSKVQILLTKQGVVQGQQYVSDDIRILAQENSKVEFVTIQATNKKNVNYQKRTSFGKKDAHVNWVDVCVGTQYTKSDVVNALQEQGATADTTILFLGADQQQYDIYTASLHEAPNTFSNLVTKGVLTSKSQALSRGLVKIEKNAPGSNGYEKQDALLLSEQAQANAIPNLEIDNHDVKCSHGSTIGQLDKEKLFYLMSRGLPKKDAEQLIIEGYFNPVLELFKDEVLQQRVQEHIVKSMQVGV
jgi:Fe-S cluster assembly protein SufD